MPRRITIVWQMFLLLHLLGAVLALTRNKATTHRLNHARPARPTCEGNNPTPKNYCSSSATSRARAATLTRNRVRNRPAFRAKFGRNSAVFGRRFVT